MSVCKVHNVRFYKPKPKAIYCMSLQKTLKKLAVSRSDAQIEIWNLQQSPFIERTIASCTENYSIEGLAWSHERLFSVGLHGLLMEYDLKRLSIKSKTSVTGQAAFCLDVNRAGTQIAVGTEQGYINIFNVDEDGVTFEKFLDKQEGRILCLKYDWSGGFIASGSMDAIRVWDVGTGNAVHRMTTGRSEANKPTIVWCLGVTEDFTVISGDSRGKVTFWDGKIGAQMESYQSHRADLLSLCLSEDEKTLYCAGIDSKIMSYVRVHVKGESYKWVISVPRRVHDHDVRALVLHEHRLYSGGVDGYLACSYHPPKTLMKYPPIMQGEATDVIQESRYILLRYPKYVEVWKLGETGEEGGGDMYSTHLPLKSDSKKLLILQRKVQSDLGKEKKEGIITCSMANNGKWIVFSTHTVLRLFHFKYMDEGEPELTLDENLPGECGVSLKSLFTPNCKQLLLVTREHTIQVVHLKAVTKLAQVIDTSRYFTDVITFLLCSPCSQFLIAADTNSNVAIWKWIEKSWKFYCKLPRYDYPLTAINIQPKTMNVIIVYSDHKMVEYNLFERKTTFSKWLVDNKYKMFTKNFPVRNVTFDPRNDRVIILQDDSSIVIVTKDKEPPRSPASKIPKIESSGPVSSSHAMHAIKKYQHLVHLGWLSNDEMVAVEVSPLTLLDQLPPGFKQNTFGTK